MAAYRGFIATEVSSPVAYCHHGFVASLAAAAAAAAKCPGNMR